MTYERMLKEADALKVGIYEMTLTPTIKGLYSNKIIGINKRIPTNAEKGCIVAEELGHYLTTAGDIIDQKIVANRKYEKRARNWAYRKLVPLSVFVQAHQSGIRNLHELADFLEITEEFLQEAIKRYIEQYGLWTKAGTYTICFEPLGVLEMFE